MSDDYQLLLDAPGEAASTLQIAALGSYSHSGYGDFAIGETDVKQWQTNLARLPGGRAPIDLDHRSDKAPRNTEAAGWITKIHDPVDGKALADVEWTSIGRDAIADRRYLFFSPSYGKFKTAAGETFDNTLTGGALTNKPFLDTMPTISLAAPERVVEAYEQLYVDGDPKLLDISATARKKAASEGNALSDGSYPIRNAKELQSAAILAASGHGDVAAAKKLIRKRAGELGVTLSHLPGFADDSPDSRRTMATDTTNVDLLKLLDLPEDADEAKILEAVTALKATAPVEGEPLKTLEQAAEEVGKRVLDAEALNALVADASAGRGAHNKLLEMEFETAFDKSVREGRSTPAMHDSRKHFFTLDREATLKELAEGPVVVNTKAPTWDNSRLLHSDPDTVPVGVHPGKHAVHEQVLKTLEAEKLPFSDYTKVFERISGANV